MNDFLTAIIQTSSECNLSCRYCYVMASRNGITRMSKSSLPALMRNCAEGHTAVRICWHGGEPLLVKVDFYKTAIQAQRRISAETGTHFKNSIQTNGTLLSPKWVDFFVENDFSVGVSFDAPPEVDQRQRLGKEPSARYIARVMEMLKASGMALNFICVVTGLNVRRGAEIFHFFSSIEADSYSLLPIMETSLPGCPKGPTNDELFELYRETFDLWLGNHKFRAVEPINTMIRSLLKGGVPRLCSFSSACLGNMVTITSKGEVVPCGSLIGPEFVIGNAFSEPVSRALASENASRLRRLRSACVEKYCSDCEFLSVCNGGCREAAFWDSGRYDGKYPYCEARKRTFSYFKGKLTDMLNLK